MRTCSLSPFRALELSAARMPSTYRTKPNGLAMPEKRLRRRFCNESSQPKVCSSLPFRLPAWHPHAEYGLIDAVVSDLMLHNLISIKIPARAAMQADSPLRIMRPGGSHRVHWVPSRSSPGLMIPSRGYQPALQLVPDLDGYQVMQHEVGHNSIDKAVLEPGMEDAMGAGSQNPSSTRPSKSSKPSKVQGSKGAGGGREGASKGRKPSKASKVRMKASKLPSSLRRLRSLRGRERRTFEVFEAPLTKIKANVLSKRKKKSHTRTLFGG